MVKLRYAKDSDFEFLIEALEEVRRIERRPAKDIPASETDKQRYRQAIKDRCIRIAEDGQEPVACLHFRTDFQVMLVHEPFFWIDLVFVRESHRGRGLGRLLYEDAMRIAKEEGFEKILLDVFAVNKRSQRFHRRLGFEPLYTIYQMQLQDKADSKNNHA
jgi:GNAT superfamily N-acetyltransferase